MSNSFGGSKIMGFANVSVEFHFLWNRRLMSVNRSSCNFVGAL